jgi:DNA repair protein RecO (recombination protein O)
MVITTKAIVLSSLKYGESDLIVKLFTESSGLKTYLLRNVLKSKKGKLRSSYFQSLSLLEIEASHKNKGTLERINEAKIFYPYQSLHTNVVKSSLVIFLAEILSNTINEEAEDKILFHFIENSLRWLDNSKDIANFHISFLLKLSLHLGFYPDTSTIAKPYFNLLEGFFQDFNTGKYNEKGLTVDNFKMFFGIDFDEINGIKLTKNERSELLTLLLQYYQLHLHGFKKPKSLSVLNQIFE